MLIARIIGFLVLFVGAYNMALPDYKWASPYMIAHGIFVDNAMVIACIGWMLVTGEARHFASSRSARMCTMLLAGLALTGVLSTAFNLMRFADYGQALRHLYFAVWLSLVVHWVLRRNVAAVLRPFLLGAVTGAVVNLYFTITDPWQTILGLPTLRSQNGAGGFLAVCVGLSAWLMAVRERRADRWVATGTLLVCLITTALSYSKTAIVICGCGLAAWLALYFRSLLRPRTMWVALSILVVATVTGVVFRDRLSDTVASVQQAVIIKFADLDVHNTYSLGARYQYFVGVSEIVRENPALGVGYSGFYEAITQTRTYRSGVMIDEDPEAGAQGVSNPHNTFLLYASANGIPGFLLASGFYVFVAFQLILVHPADRVLRFILGCLAAAYFVYAMTLPTLLDTPVLFIAAAIACAGRGRLSAVARATRLRAAQRLEGAAT